MRREINKQSTPTTTCGQPLYSRPDCPVYDQSTRWDNTVVAAKNAELACLRRKGENGPTWVLAARNPKEGKELWTHPLPAEPVRWAIAVDGHGRIMVTLRTGQVLCFGAKPDAAQ